MYIQFLLLLVASLAQEFYQIIQTQIDETKTSVYASGTAVRDIQDCHCDYSSLKCEFGCCCDADCDPAQIQYWNEQGECLQQQNQKTCVKSFIVTFINPKRGMRVVQDQQNKLLCVENDLNYIYDSFQEQRLTLPIKTIKEYEQNLSISLGFILQNNKTINYTPYKGYTLQEYVNPDRNQEWSVFYPDTFGVCSKYKNVNFLRQIDKTFCTQSYTLEQNCKSGGLLDWTYYVTLGMVLKNTIILPDGQLLKSEASLDLSNIRFYKRVGTSYVLQSEGMGSIKLVDLSCLDAFIGVRYSLIYDETKFLLYSFEATVYLQDIIQKSISNTQTLLPFIELNFMNQKGTFYDGNLGYKQGGKVFGLPFDSLGIAISNSGEGGQCVVNQTVLPIIQQDPQVLSYLRFGQDISVSCGQKMNIQELEANCNIGYLQSLEIFASIPYILNNTKLSKFAYSDPNIPQNFIDVKLLELINEVTYDPIKQECKMPLSYNLEIFYSQIGYMIQLLINYFLKRVLKVLQNTIVDAYAGYSEYKILNIQEGYTKSLNFQFIVKYTNIKLGLIENDHPQNPPFVPQIPGDFFFPVWYETQGMHTGIIIMSLLVYFM